METIAASSACGFLHGTAFAEAFRQGGQDALRQSFNSAMAGPCAMMPDADICQSDKHREQICADWFMKRGPCSDALVEFRTQNRQLCAATRSVALDYPEIDTTAGAGRRAGAAGEAGQAEAAGEAAAAAADPVPISAIRAKADEMRLRCESANVPFFQSMLGQARAQFPDDPDQASAAADRAFSSTMAGFCEMVRGHPDENVRLAYPMCADRSSQAAACAGWFSAARCEGPANREYAEAHPALCMAARRAALGNGPPVSE
jgi:hypothetical protein